MEITLPLDEVILRSAAAVVLGAILGWEREAADKPAGFRTHMMVALGAAAFTLVTVGIYDHALANTNRPPPDPLRMVAGVIGGIGFLGAGTIIQSRGSVQGITTAATIWVVGSVGIACGMGAFQVAITTVVLAFVILRLMGWLEGRHLPSAAPDVPENKD